MPTKLRQPFLIVLLFAVLVCVHTWPLVTAPATLSRNDNADTELNEWIISWIAHALATNPRDLFNGNIFYPVPRTIALSEPLLVPALLGAPLLWLGASPVLTYNVLVMLGMLSMALAMYFAVVSFTSDRFAGVFGATVFVFTSQYLDRICHLQALFSAPLPLAIWALDRLLTVKQARYGLWLALFIACSAYTSGYLCVFVSLSVMVGLVARCDEWTGKNARSCLPCLALAGIAALALVFPISWVYWRTHLENGLFRSLADCIPATPMSYLTSDAYVYEELWDNLREYYAEPALFPGIIASLCALVGMANLSRTKLARSRSRMFVALAAVGFVLSLGTATPVYGWLYGILPPLRGLRAVCRFGWLVGLACAALAGLGLSDLRHRLGSRACASTLAVCAILMANVEGLHLLRRKFVPFKGIPSIYKIIGQDPAAIVVEFPIPSVSHLNAAYMLNSTVHWRPLINGYSGYSPASYRLASEILKRFPARGALATLRDRGVTHVMLNMRKYKPHEAASIIHLLSREPDFQLLGVDNEHGLRLYRRLPNSHEAAEARSPP